MLKMLLKIFEYKDLMSMLTLRDLRVRYKQAAMGFLWAIFMPIIAVFAGIIIKQAMAMVAKVPLESKSVVSLAVKVLPWTFFISSIRFSVQSLVGNISLVTKIYFPRAILVFSSILACLFDFAVAMPVLGILLFIYKIGVSVHLVWLPVLILAMVLFTTGLGLILSAANLFFRDVKYIVEILLMFGIFFTPVFYEAASFGKWKNIMLLNPLGSILEEINKVVVLQQTPDLFWLFYGVISSLIVFIIGMVFFHKSEKSFAEFI